jgi:hypothetical protein
MLALRITIPLFSAKSKDQGRTNNKLLFNKKLLFNRLINMLNICIFTQNFNNYGSQEKHH